MGAPQGLQYVLASGTSNISSHLSETFAAFISEECFGRQPMTKYASPTAKKLFLQHLRLFLEYRGENSYGAPTLLPNLVRNVIDHFMTATETRATLRSAYMRRVCNAIRDYCPATFKLATKPSPTTCEKIASDPVESHCLLIAIWMDDEDLVWHYLEDGVSVWEPTEAFPSPLIAAAEYSDVEVVSLLLKYAKGDLAFTTRAKPVKILDCAVYVAMRVQDWDTAIILIDWWYQHCRKPQPDQVVEWIRKAVRADAMEFLYQVLDQQLTAATKKRLVECLFDPCYAWGIDSLDGLARAMIARGFLDVSQSYTSKGESFSGSLLALAVKMADIKLAKRCLKMGMSANGLAIAGGELENPLATAVRIGDEAMIRLLLEHNADPIPAEHIVPLGYCKPGEEIIKRVGTLIHEAACSKRLGAFPNT